MLKVSGEEEDQKIGRMQDIEFCGSWGLAGGCSKTVGREGEGEEEKVDFN